MRPPQGSAPATAPRSSSLISIISQNDVVFFVHCDGHVAKESNVQNVVEFAVEKHGKLDIMFNNAGTTGNLTPTIFDVCREDFSKVFDVNAALSWAPSMPLGR